ncbi:hypothetical protein D3C79_670510 [compost metagenome]
MQFVRQGLDQAIACRGDRQVDRLICCFSIGTEVRPRSRLCKPWISILHFLIEFHGLITRSIGKAAPILHQIAIDHIFGDTVGSRSCRGKGIAKAMHTHAQFKINGKDSLHLILIIAGEQIPIGLIRSALAVQSIGPRIHQFGRCADRFIQELFMSSDLMVFSKCPFKKRHPCFQQQCRVFGDQVKLFFGWYIFDCIVQVSHNGIHHQLP